MIRKNILFLCTGNSARSILAEVITNLYFSKNFFAYSAGSKPSGRVNKEVSIYCKNLGYPVEKLKSKSWNIFLSENSPKINILITVCDRASNEVCPFWKNSETVFHWNLPDPVIEINRLLMQKKLDELCVEIKKRMSLLEQEDI